MQQQMHMSHQQYEIAQQAQQDQQQHYEAHVGHKREAEDADCEQPCAQPPCLLYTNQLIRVLLCSGHELVTVAEVVCVRFSPAFPVIFLAVRDL